jgi:hypothetical protein
MGKLKGGGGGLVGSGRRIAISGLRRHYRNRRCEIDYYFVEYVSECNWEGTSIYVHTSTLTLNPTPVFSKDDLLLHYEGNDSSTLRVVQKLKMCWPGCQCATWVPKKTTPRPPIYSTQLSERDLHLKTWLRKYENHDKVDVRQIK